MTKKRTRASAAQPGRLKTVIAVHDPNDSDLDVVYYESLAVALDNVAELIQDAKDNGGPLMLTITLAQMTEQAFAELREV